jgi:hypothetical protein
MMIAWSTIGKTLSHGQKAYSFLQECKRANDVDIPGA